MAFIHNIWLILVYESPPTSIVLFLLSSSMLIAGIAVQTWKSAFQLSGVEKRALSWVEAVHPHLPSVRTIIVIALTSLGLLIAGLQLLDGIFPFNDAYQGLNLTSLFLLCTTVGVLAELRWKGAHEYMLAFLEGTAGSFLCYILLRPSDRSMQEQIIIFLILVASITMAELTLDRSRRYDVILVLCTTFIFWAVIWSIALP